MVPFLHVDTLGWSATESATITHLVTKAVTISGHSSSLVVPAKGLSIVTFLKVFYWLVVSYQAIKLAMDVRSVIGLIRRNPGQSVGSMRIIRVPETMPASSFFHYIFLPSDQVQGEAMAVTIRHEQVHAQQWHTLDWLFVRLVSALFWFNPLMRHWQRAITINHEYLADATTVKTYDSLRYSHLLVSLAAESGFNSTLHYFSSSQLKSRIIMIHQLRSKAVQRLRFLLVTPLLGLLLFIVSCEQSATRELISPSLLPKGTRLFSDLIGSWTNTNRTTINANDGNTPRDFPERGGNVLACLSNLVLGADGRFQMTDGRTGQIVQGTWESDPVGISVQLHITENPSSRSNYCRVAAGNVSVQLHTTENPSSTDRSLPVLYNRDGSIFTGPFTKTIALDVTSLKNGTFEAWQSYAADDHLSAGQVYYQYQKE